MPCQLDSPKHIKAICISKKTRDFLVNVNYLSHSQHVVETQ